MEGDDGRFCAHGPRVGLLRALVIDQMIARRCAFFFVPILAAGD